MQNTKFRQYKNSDKQAVNNLHRIALESTDAYAVSGKWDADLDDIEYVYLKNGDFLVGFVG